MTHGFAKMTGLSCMSNPYTIQKDRSKEECGEKTVIHPWFKDGYFFAGKMPILS
ncbi:hypothetical protein J8TS2_27090 [Lederbergia ruris]|uniref:Uncharacterized protein n=1 Tax=Lederbergia ruris TaxID=217495 RepID=A0ABQ4KKA8_9BACI|nr:hypothetical protein J8TS2_27090 [Lederbergia ruris]